MQRLNDPRLAATLAVGASLALVPAPAAGQTANEPGVPRPSVPALPDAGASGLLVDPAGRRTFFEVPVYGNPPGSGAGTTGFVSSGAVRRKGRPKPKSGLKPALPPRNVNPVATPATAMPGTAGLRPVPQLTRHGAPPIDLPPSLAPAPPVVAPPRRAAAHVGLCA